MRPYRLQGSLRVLRCPYAFLWVLLGSCMSLCVSMDPHGSLKVFMGP